MGKPADPAGAGFVVVHGNRLEDLRDLVVELLRLRPQAPLVPELFLVQSNGMKHWLEQALAQDDALGICAATPIMLPAKFLWQAYRAVLGPAVVPLQLPFDKDALTWRLLRMLPQLAMSDAAFLPLARYLEADRAGERASDRSARRRFQLAQQVADVFDGYQQYRADWLGDWEEGRDELRRPGAAALPVPAAQAWQPRLWRALREDIGVAAADASRAAVHRQFEAAMQAWPEGQPCPAAIPPRIWVFGISALPLQSVRALAELGRVAQVLMVVQNPCQHYWGHVVEGRALLGRLVRHRQTPRGGRAIDDLPDDPALLHAESHALLASWGRQGRDYLHLLDEFDQSAGRPHLLSRVDAFRSPVDPGDGSPVVASRLRLLQASILELAPPPPAPEPVDDRSMEFVMAHSAQREVEVLHDRVLEWLDEDDSLQPRDLMVMVPDMANFAAQIHAVFGRFPAGHPRHVPYSVADTSARQLPLVQALERLLGIADSRITLADWLGLFEVAAVRRRFDLGEAEVAQLHDWLADAGVRWGIDAAHRRQWGLAAGVEGIEQNTWAFGLRRLLLGYATGGREPWQGVLPLPAAGGLAAQSIGKLAEWLLAMDQTLHEFAAPRTPTDWAATLSTVLGRFFVAADEADERMLARLAEHLQDWLQRCESAALVEELPLVVVREHWMAQVEATELSQRFFGGGVQFATLMPMRSIPFRVVCLLGMNDADYPRRAQPRDFDLMAGDWRPGDRSRREDDRYLFLEALLSARDRLYVSWQGRRATDNAELPPSVVVAQLLEETGRRFAPAPQPVLQPLQPFSAQYFDMDSAFRTYDADWAVLHAATVTPIVAGPTAPAEPVARREVLTLEDLERLLRQPAEVFWRARLGVVLDQPDAADEEDEPFALDRLQEYQAGDLLIDALAAGDSGQAIEKVRLSGVLPIAAAGQRSAERLADVATRVRARADSWIQSHPERPDPLPIDLCVEGVRITGSLHDLHANETAGLQLKLRPGAVRHKKSNRMVPRHHVFVASWVRQVAAAAAGHTVGTVLLGVDDALHLPPVPQGTARELLAGWIRAWHAAWEAPLPVACRTAFAFLDERSRAGETPVDEFEGAQRRGGAAGELRESPYLQRSFEGYEDIEAGLAEWASVLYGGLRDALEAADRAEQDP